MTRNHGLAVLTLVGLATTTFTACANLGASATPNGSGAATSSVSQSCDAPPDLSKKPTAVAILAENGSTASAHYKDDVKTVLTGAESLKARLIVSGIGSNGNTLSDLVDTVLVGDGNNDTFRNQSLACKKERLAAAFTTLAKQPNPKPLDIFSAIYTLYNNLQDTPKGTQTNVVLLTSLLNNASTGNLGDVTTASGIDKTLNNLATARLKPDCTGWRVQAVGSDSNTQQNAALREFWRRYFAWCGGALVDWSTSVTVFPVTGPAIEAADLTQIPIQVEVTPKAVTATLGGDVLFDPGSPALRAGAADELDQLLNQVNAHPGNVVVSGYTDVGGDLAANKRLGTERANTLVAWLVSRHVPASRLTAVGVGSDNPVFANPTTAAERQANRRIVAVIYTP